MAGETSDKHEDREWLVEIIREQSQSRSIEITREREQQRSLKPRIQKVDGTLRQIQSYKEHLGPKVVALGPYNSGNDQEHLKPMERYKKIAAAWFISLATSKKQEDNIAEVEVNIVYDKFIKEATRVSSPIECYADPESIRDRFGEEVFMRGMFLDGCFILHFICLLVEGWPDHFSKSSPRLNQKDIMRDMFLLENQIPFSILNALMRILPDPRIGWNFISAFIFIFVLDRHGSYTRQISSFRSLISFFKEIFPRRRDFVYGVPFRDEINNCHHLLDALHYMLVGRDRYIFSPSGTSDSYLHIYRPIMVLKATGIQVRRSNSTKLRNVKFKRGLFYSYLEIPAILVDDSTKTRLLNMIAYEMCSDGPEHRTVTAFVCFLHSLIHNVDDVKELQSENILLNHLGSEEDAVKLFKELGTLLYPYYDPHPYYDPYGNVIAAIHAHYRRRFNHERVKIGQWISQFKRTYFISPWTAISLIAGIFLLLLTLLQTIYSIWGFYKPK